MEDKTFREYCKDAKKRLKNGFWQEYKRGLEEKVAMAKMQGVSETKVKEYYINKVSENIKNKQEDFESFYLRVRKILDEEGEISGVISRLTDFSVYNSLTYEEQQRYNLTLSEKYLKALERYKKEKMLKVD